MNPLRIALRRAVRTAPFNVPRALVQHLDDHLAQNPHQAVAVTRHGARFLVDTRDIIQRYLYLFGTWEPHISAWISRRLAPGDTFIDVGAHIGHHTLLASQTVGPEGQVVAIEPVPDFHRRLQAAVDLNRAHNVRTVRRAVGDRRAQVELFLADPGNLGGTTGAVRPKNVFASFHAEVSPLPDIATSAELHSARIIKLDIEGAKPKRYAPCCLTRPDALRCRADHRDHSAHTRPTRLRPEDIVDPLREAGFHPYRMINDYSATNYPRAIHRPLPPQRWEQPITGMSDLVFSRTDTTIL
ncbi:FkbM family methyltransferase [Nocardiopsis alba]|uniref:FkbM family methyltransferase n=1 Tax=Nocardiopsis alba TaxID=53437 RepID=UPI001EEDC923|nr:FkbM family methyltransferase [Nocardiopsis alba]